MHENKLLRRFGLSDQLLGQFVETFTGIDDGVDIESRILEFLLNNRQRLLHPFKRGKSLIERIGRVAAHNRPQGGSGKLLSPFSLPQRGPDTQNGVL